jgi:hypothetical protein
MPSLSESETSRLLPQVLEIVGTRNGAFRPIECFQGPGGRFVSSLFTVRPLSSSRVERVGQAPSIKPIIAHDSGKEKKLSWSF